jgi:hypothetical protein
MLTATAAIAGYLLDHRVADLEISSRDISDP